MTQRQPQPDHVQAEAPSDEPTPPVSARAASQLVTCLAVDLAESSEVLERLGEGRTAVSRSSYLTLLRNAVAAHQGSESARSGDRVLVVFDVPSEAVACAVAVQRAAARHDRRRSDRLDIRIGIQVGEADETTLVSEQGDYIARPAVEAGQLCDAAVGSQILASDLVAVLARSEGSFEFERTGLLDLAGSSAPVPTFEVSHEHVAAEHPPLPPELAARPAGRSSFVGRAEERERLRDVWAAAADGERRLAFVMGEPGIGKSRLAAEFAAELHADGAVVLSGRSFEESIMPYQPFVEAMRQYVTDCDPADLEGKLGGDPDALVRLVPELAAHFPQGASAEQEEGERYRLFDAVASFLATVSLGSPMVLVLDDLQWADRGTLLLLKHVVLDPRPASILILCLYRDTDVDPAHPLTGLQADVERDFAFDRVQLGGLREPEVASMLDEIIGWSPPVSVARGLRSDTEGNPFFLQEVIHQLDETGIAADRERMSAGQLVAGELGVPTRVRDFVARRLQRLSMPAREALGVAAVAGTEFEMEILRVVLGLDDLQLLDRLEEAVEARLAIEVPGRLGTYAFGHALFQQVLYESHGLNRRAALHARVAEAIESLRPDDPSTLSDLARHYALTAGRYSEKVVHYAAAAGDQAIAGLAYEDAVEEYTRALDALPLAAAPSDGTRADLLVRLGDAQRRVGDTAGAKQSYSEAADGCDTRDSSGTLARAALGYGGTAGFGGVWETFSRVDEVLIDLLDRALAAQPVGDGPVRVRLLGRLAQALYWSDDRERMRTLSQEAVDTARRLGDDAAVAHALDSRHVALWGPDHATEIRAAAEEMLALGQSLGDREIQLKACAWLITDALETDPIEVVDRYIAEHARLAGELRQPYHLWYTEVTHTLRAHMDGRFEDMARLAQLAFDHGQQPHAVNALQTRLVHMFILHLELGRMGELIDDLAGYVAQSPLPTWRAALAMAYASMDRRDEAAAELAFFTREDLTAIPRDCVWLATLGELSQVVARVGAVEHARPLYDLLLPFGERDCVVGGGVMCLGPVSWFLGLLAATIGDVGQAVLHLDHALTRSRNLRSPPFSARVGANLAAVLLARGSEEDLARARDLLDEANGTASRLGMAQLARETAELAAALAGPVQATSG